MSSNITQPSLLAAAGNMLYHNLGLVCLEDPHSCFPPVPEDLCSALSFGAFSLEVAVPPLSFLSRPLAHVAFAAHLVARWIESSHCFPATTSFQQNSTGVLPTLAHVRLITGSEGEVTTKIVRDSQVITNALRINSNPFAALNIDFKQLMGASTALESFARLQPDLQQHAALLDEIKTILGQTTGRFDEIQTIKQEGPAAIALVAEVAQADRLKALYNRAIGVFSPEHSTQLATMLGKMSRPPAEVRQTDLNSLQELMEKLQQGYNLAAHNAVQPTITTEIQREVIDLGTETRVLPGAKNAVGRFALISQFAIRALCWAVSFGSALQRQHDINERYRLQSNATGAAETVSLEGQQHTALAETGTCSDGDTCPKPNTAIVIN